MLYSFFHLSATFPVFIIEHVLKTRVLRLEVKIGCFTIGPEMLMSCL